MEYKVGDKRTFSFSDSKFEIKEILELPNIQMRWTWNTSICPHCKRKIEYSTIHIFFKIEILVDETKEEGSITLDDLVILGHSVDNKIMQLTKDKYVEVLNKSEKFKYLLEKS